MSAISEISTSEKAATIEEIGFPATIIDERNFNQSAL